MARKSTTYIDPYSHTIINESKTYAYGKNDFNVKYGETVKGNHFQKLKIDFENRKDGGNTSVSSYFYISKKALVKRHYSQAWEKLGFPSLSELATEIADTMKEGFTTAHENSYIAKSIVAKGQSIQISAPKYNMIGFLNGDDLKFDSSKSYASELDEKGSVIAVKRQRQRKSKATGKYTGYGKEIACRVYVGNWKGYVNKFIVDGVVKWAVAHNLHIEKMTAR